MGSIAVFFPFDRAILMIFLISSESSSVSGIMDEIIRGLFISTSFLFRRRRADFGVVCKARVQGILFVGLVVAVFGSSYFVQCPSL